MVRVAQVVGSLRTGGVETMVVNCYKAIDKSRVQFDFIVHTPEKQPHEDEIIAMGGRVFHFPRFSGFNVIKIRSMWKRFFREHPEITVLHSHIRSYASVYLPIAKRFGVKTLVHSHSTSNGKGFSALFKTLLQYPLRYQADRCIACSREAGEWLFGKKSIENGKCLILGNAVDTQVFRFDPLLRESTRAQEGLEGKKVYIHVGRLNEAKNHLFLLDVFAGILKKQENSVLLIVGSGSMEKAILQKISALGIEKNVRLLGSRNDVNALLQAADCFLFPSLWEGAPLSLIEAQTAGLPCLISDRITKDVVISLLVRSLSIESAQVWADEALRETPERSDLSGIAETSGFGIQTFAKKLESIYLSGLN